jgi:hypothetical protein
LFKWVLQFYHLLDAESVMRRNQAIAGLCLFAVFIVSLGLFSTQTAASPRQVATDLPAGSWQTQTGNFFPADLLLFDRFADSGAEGAGIGETDPEAASSLFWSILVSALVAVITGAIAALPYAAMKQWQGHWKTLAMLPLAVLLIWVAVIALSILLNPNSHSLWAFEIFAWAMGTSVYIVILITAKRAFEKEDQKEGSSD